MDERDGGEVVAEPMTLKQQRDYWMERFFAELDEKVALINQLNAIEAIIHPATPERTEQALLDVAEAAQGWLNAKSQDEELEWAWKLE